MAESMAISASQDNRIIWKDLINEKEEDRAER